jgi:hypothetical protein
METVQKEMRRTGLSEVQVLNVVARSLMVRHLSQIYPDRFWLKGGGLLYHVYGSPRASFTDTDMADISKEFVTGIDLSKIFTLKGDGYYVAGKDGTWGVKDDIVQGEVPFFIQNFRLKKDDSKLKLSVSLRKGEVLDKRPPMNYNALDLLTGQNIFKVNGLSLEELSAEKTLGWCIKQDLYKHYIDLALIARNFGNEIEISNYSSMLSTKFYAEKKSEQKKEIYAILNLKTPEDLRREFGSRTKLLAMEKDWRKTIDSNIYLTREERARPDSIANLNNVMDLVNSFWTPVLESLKGLDL